MTTLAMIDLLRQNFSKFIIWDWEKVREESVASKVQTKFFRSWLILCVKHLNILQQGAEHSSTLI